MLISKAGVLLITLSLLLTQQNVSGIAPLVVIRGAIEIVGAIQTAIDVYKAVGEQAGFIQSDHDQILARFDDISNQIAESNKLNSHLANWTVVSLIEYMKHDESLREEKKLLALLADEIDLIVSKTRDNMDTNKIEELQIDHVNKINELLIKYTHAFIGPIKNKDDRPADTSVLGLLATVYHRDNHKICNTAQSVQQYVISVANDVLLYQLKGYAAAHFSLLYCGGNSTKQRNILDSSFKQILHSIRRKLFHTVKTLDRNIWRCDPEVHKQGKTFEQLTGFMQGFIENENYLNDKFCLGTCEYNNDKPRAATFEKNICRGNKYDCTALVDDSIDICLASPDNITRYTHVKTKDHSLFKNAVGFGPTAEKIYGEKTCNGELLSADKNKYGKMVPTPDIAGTIAKSITAIFSEAHSCEWCYCVCEKDEGNNKFSMQPALSNIKKNMVVTGIRFKRVGDTFYPQIRQGQLECYGFINSTTLKWANIKRKKVFPKIVMDYSWRFMELNRIVVDNSTSSKYPTIVVTGVKFERLYTVKRVQLYIQVNEFDYITGKVSGRSEWITPQMSSSLIKLNEPDVPTRTTSKSLPGKEVNSFIQFQVTDLKKDIGQHIVPFLDMQEVVSNPPVPLSGIGLFHKSVDGYGGFIAPEIITINFAQAANHTFEATIKSLSNKKKRKHDTYSCKKN